MKALSLKQPWATMIAEGEKTIETRMWSTRYRGNLLIVSSKAIDRNGPIRFAHAPTGVAICMATLVDCRPMGIDDVVRAVCCWEAGRFAWILNDVRRVSAVPIKGQLGLFEVPDEVVR